MNCSFFASLAKGAEDGLVVKTTDTKVDCRIQSSVVGSFKTEQGCVCTCVCINQVKLDQTNKTLNVNKERNTKVVQWVS